MSVLAYKISPLRAKDAWSVSNALNFLEGWRNNQAIYFKDLRGATSVVKLLICPHCRKRRVQQKNNGQLICRDCQKILNGEMNMKLKTNDMKEDENYRHTIFFKRKGGDIEFYPKTIVVKTPGFLFRPPKSRQKEGMPLLTIPDTVFLNIPAGIKMIKLLKMLHKPVLLPQAKKSSKKNEEKLKCVTNWQKFDYRYISAVEKYYRQIFTSPLNYYSIERQNQGKNNVYRSYTYGKRIYFVARATILPSHDISCLETIFVPTEMYEKLKRPSCCLLKRDPALNEENFIYANIKTWDFNAIGLSSEFLDWAGGDYDGDCMVLIPVYSLESKIEARLLASVRENCFSLTAPNGLKLSPCQDTIYFFYYALVFQKHWKHLRRVFVDKFVYCDEGLFFSPQEIKVNVAAFNAKETLNKMLKVTADMHGSEACVRTFENLRLFTYFMNRHHSYSFNLDELAKYRQVGKDCSISDFVLWFEDYVPTPEDYFAISIKSGAKGTAAHLYQLIGRNFGECKNFYLQPEQKFKSAIVGNFLNGLPVHSFIAHCQNSVDNYLSSKYIGRLGYMDQKNKYCFQDIVVDNLYDLRNKKKPFFKNVLNYVDVNRILMPETFTSILYSVV